MKKVFFLSAFALFAFAASAQKGQTAETMMPDLAVGGVTAEEATIKIEILNKGTGKASDIWIETKIGMAPKNRQKIDMLGAGEMKEIEIAVTTGAPADVKMVKIEVDPGNKIKESSETNNKYPIAPTNDPAPATKKGMTKKSN